MMITDWLLRIRKPLTYAVSYVEADGTREVDCKDCMTCAEWWADWCRRDGCTEVAIRPIYSERELADRP